MVGAGAEVDQVCAGLCASYAEVWKVASDSLAYPNAELIRKALVKVIPQGSIVLVPHNHFGDLGPGLSVKLNVPVCNDWLAKGELCRLERLRISKRRADWRFGRCTAKRAPQC